MERFLTPRLEQELSTITLEYIYAKERTFIGVPNFVKRNVTSNKKIGHQKILTGWMIDDLVPSDYEIWESLKVQMYLAGLCIAKLGDMLVHISSPFYIIYCPEKMQEFQKFRMRLWWEFLSKTDKICEVSQFCQGTEISYTTESLDLFLEKEQITNDAYIRTLAKKFYPDAF